MARSINLEAMGAMKVMTFPLKLTFAYFQMGRPLRQAKKQK
jgi:hypothetical protein